MTTTLAEASLAQPSRTVLLVDDDPILRRLSSRQISAAGFQVLDVGTCTEALELIRSRRPDVVVSDVVLDEVDGFTLCRMIRGVAGFQDLPVVLISAYFQANADKALALAAGASALTERSPDGQAELAAIALALSQVPQSLTATELINVSDLYSRRLKEQLSQLLTKASAAEARYQVLFESSKDAVSILTTDGIILELNGCWERILQLPKAQIIGHHIRDFSPQEAKDSNVEMYHRNQSSGSLEAAPVMRADGSVAHMEISLTPIEADGQKLVLCIGRDVTEQLGASKRLEASEARYRLLLESIPDIVWTAAPDGRMTFASKNIETICGFSMEEALQCGGGFWQERVHPDDSLVLRDALRTLATTQRPVDLTFRWQRKDEAWIWLNVRARAAIRDGVPCIDGVTSEVTERKSLEEQMRQSQKMEAVGQLTGGVAHDFNNILAAVLANTHFLMEDLAENDPRRSDVIEIKTGAERAANLTRQLLAFSRRQILAPTQLDLNTTVNGVEKMLRRLIGEDIEFIVSHHADPAMVLADPGQIEQVIMNLVVNARDAMPIGGKLSLETSTIEVSADNAASHAPAVPGRYVMLSVSDTGCGMDAETQRRAFEPFFTTKEQGKGTGLGLSTCYGIVKQSGGHIGVHSELGHGTTFKIYLPQIINSEVQRSGPDRALTSDLRGSETILVIEDEEPLRRALQRHLKNLGYRVVLACNGAEALDAVQAQNSAIDLVLSDVIMPGVSGPDIVERIKQLSPRTKSLFMSGYTAHAALETGLIQGGTNFIHKPFAPSTLARRIRESLDAK